jgi:hypothetical protein
MNIKLIVNEDSDNKPDLKKVISCANTDDELKRSRNNSKRNVTLSPNPRLDRKPRRRRSELFGFVKEVSPLKKRPFQEDIDPNNINTFHNEI